jgi:hypothetical protein
VKFQKIKSRGWKRSHLRIWVLERRANWHYRVPQKLCKLFFKWFFEIQHFYLHPMTIHVWQLSGLLNICATAPMHGNISECGFWQDRQWGVVLTSAFTSLYLSSKLDNICSRYSVHPLFFFSKSTKSVWYVILKVHLDLWSRGVFNLEVCCLFLNFFPAVKCSSFVSGFWGNLVPSSETYCWFWFWKREVHNLAIWW